MVKTDEHIARNVDNRVKTAVLVSGGGTNLQALIDARDAGRLAHCDLALVVSSRADAYALTRAQNAGIPHTVVAREQYADREAFSRALLDTVRARNIEAVLLAGFQIILNRCFTDAYRDRMLNVHPSLIPAFCGEGFYGLRVHEAALAAGVKVTGATVHLVNEIPDGGRIILQKAVEVLAGDTPERLQKRVMVQAEQIILPQAAEQMCRQWRRRDLGRLLAANAYPGRGIVVGLSEDGRRLFCAYFIMGRSVNSRNRVFVEQGDTIVTRAFDESKMTDPSLVLYTAVRKAACGNTPLVVSNGDQTDTIAAFLRENKTFRQALETRTYEPDAPNYTPRISALIERGESGFTYTISIVKRGDDGEPVRLFWTLDPPVAGEGHMIHTYEHDGDPLPTFAGEPTRIAVTGTLDEFTRDIWENLNEENKISLFARSIDRETGEERTIMLNKNERSV